MSNDMNDGVIGTLTNVVVDYAVKSGKVSPLEWIQDEFEKEKDVWDSDEKRRHEASEILNSEVCGLKELVR